MNPEICRFEPLHTRDTGTALERLQQMETAGARGGLLRPDGSPVPEHWTILTVGERVEVRGISFEVRDISTDRLILEPVGPALIGDTGGLPRPTVGNRKMRRQQEKLARRG